MLYHSNITVDITVMWLSLINDSILETRNWFAFSIIVR